MAVSATLCFQKRVFFFFPSRESEELRSADAARLV
jgi:hypothetical protein